MKRPDFPKWFPELQPYWGMGNKAVGLNLVASIPNYSLIEEGPEHDESEKLYYAQKLKEYNQAKDLYEKNCHIGTVWAGNTEMSARITKIFISETKAYICWKASNQAIELCRAKNLEHNFTPPLKPPGPGRMGILPFLSMIQNGGIRIISIPKQ